MFKWFCLVIFIFIFFNLLSKAQSVRIIGKVRDAGSKNIIVKANIKWSKGKKILNEVSTDTLGVYVITVSDLLKEGILSITHIGYEPFNLPLRIDLLKKDERNIVHMEVIDLKQSAIALDEVIIKNDQRYKDTTLIDLSQHKFERSVMIADLLSGLNGFSKSNDGQLYYKGKVVSDIQVNGESFFGSNNREIYKNLPALILNTIQVLETNIDSVSNITMLRPVVTLNLNLKEKYQKGKFGQFNIGRGSSDRYVASTDLYTYNKKEQIHFALNSNNINVSGYQLAEPNVRFSSVGNNNVNNFLRLDYRNVLWKKLELNSAVNLRYENKLTEFWSERSDMIVNQFSRTYNSSKSKIFGNDGLNTELIYRPNKYDRITVSLAYIYSNSRQNDSLTYNILRGNTEMFSRTRKYRAQGSDVFNLGAAYSRSFPSKEGRKLNIKLNAERSYINVTERNKIHSLEQEGELRYFLNGKNVAHEKQEGVLLTFLEPIGELSNIVFGLDMKRHAIEQKSFLTSDKPVTDASLLNRIENEYFYPNLTFQKKINRLFFTGLFGGKLNLRRIEDIRKEKITFFNLDLNFVMDYKINSKRNLLTRFLVQPEYPTINQLFNINNSFSLVSQNVGNSRLRPEIKQALETTYDLKKSDSLNVSFSTRLSKYSSKFGFTIKKSDNIIQQTYDNIGNSFSAEGGLSVSFVTKNWGSFSYTGNFGYQGLPVVSNEKKIISRGFNFTQSFSTSKSFFHGKLMLSPVISLSGNKMYYDENVSGVFMLTYSDKYTFQWKNFELSIFPLLIYNNNQAQRISWAMNGEVKKKIFKEYGTLWLKAYDVFNSFKFTNNMLNASFTETIMYSNIQRYFVIGFSIKFNNMK